MHVRVIQTYVCGIDAGPLLTECQHSSWDAPGKPECRIERTLKIRGTKYDILKRGMFLKKEVNKDLHTTVGSPDLINRRFQPTVLRSMMFCLICSIERLVPENK